MHKTIVFLLLATNTIIYSGCFEEEDDDFTKVCLLRKDVLPYLQSKANLIKMDSYISFTDKTNYEEANVKVYAHIADDGSSVTIRQAPANAPLAWQVLHKEPVE